MSKNRTSRALQVAARERMARTGERYTAALQAVVAQNREGSSGAVFFDPLSHLSSGDAPATVITGDPGYGFSAAAVERMRERFPDEGEDQIAARLISETTRGIPLGVSDDGSAVVFDPVHDIHLLVAGNTGSGKTTVCQRVVSEALLRGHECAVISPVNGSSYSFAEPRLFTSSLGSGARDALSALRSVVEEMRRRQKLLLDRNVPRIDELPDGERPEPFVVVIDEYVTFVSDPEVSDEVRDSLHRLLLESRSAGFSVVLSAQEVTTKTLLPSMSENIGGRLLLGDSSYSRRVATLRRPDDTPWMLGRRSGEGVYESFGGKPRTVRVTGPNVPDADIDLRAISRQYFPYASEVATLLHIDALRYGMEVSRSAEVNLAVISEAATALRLASEADPILAASVQGEYDALYSAATSPGDEKAYIAMRQMSVLRDSMNGSLGESVEVVRRGDERPSEDVVLDALVPAGDEPDDLFRGVARGVLDALRSRGVEIPERIADADYASSGWETSEVSAAKNIVYDVIESGVRPELIDDGYDAISHADAVVSKLIAGGVRIPESLG